jgi:hypothetical protein
MNTTILLTKDYEQITMNNEPIKTNPISEESKMSLTHYMTKEYENKSGLLTMEKQTQSNPIANQPPHFQNFPRKATISQLFSLFLFSFFLNYVL